MGLEPQQASRKYLKIRDAKFYLTSDKEKTNPYSKLTGTLTGIATKEITHEGSKFEVINADFNDNGEKYQLSINLGDGYGSTFLTSLTAADLSKPLTLSPYTKSKKAEGSDKVYTNYYLSIWQDDALVKGNYTFEQGKKNSIPKVEWVEVGRKTHKNDSKLVDFLKEIVVNVNLELNGNPAKKNGTPKTTTTKTSQFGKTTSKTMTDANDITEEDDSLPF